MLPDISPESSFLLCLCEVNTIEKPAAAGFFILSMATPLRILELSLPHATDSGTLRDSMHLPQAIAHDGFNAVLLLPWMKVDTAASSSPYAVTDHLHMNDSIGTLEEARSWISLCHAYGLKVVLDMPLNHTSPHHRWSEHPQWYAKDALGNRMAPRDTNWNDVVQLNHANADVIRTCKEVLLFWLNLGVDGFRLDAAAWIPDEVVRDWVYDVKQATRGAAILWCDGRDYALRTNCFDAWLNHEAILLARQNRSAWEREIAENSPGAIYYLSNHDTLHRGKSPEEEWPGHYQSMRDILLASNQLVLLSMNDWRNPHTHYSFMLAR